jgi:hypothetical protein
MREKSAAIKREGLRVFPGQASKEGPEKIEFECDLCGKVAASKSALCRPRKREGDD